MSDTKKPDSSALSYESVREWAERWLTQWAQKVAPSAVEEFAAEMAHKSGGGAQRAQPDVKVSGSEIDVDQLYAFLRNRFGVQSQIESEELAGAVAEYLTQEGPAHFTISEKSMPGTVPGPQAQAAPTAVAHEGETLDETERVAMERRLRDAGATGQVPRDLKIHRGTASKEFVKQAYGDNVEGVTLPDRKEIFLKSEDRSVLYHELTHAVEHTSQPSGALASQVGEKSLEQKEHEADQIAAAAVEAEAGEALGSPPPSGERRHQWEALREQLTEMVRRRLEQSLNDFNDRYGEWDDE